MPFASLTRRAFLALFFLLLSPLHAGSADALLQGKSASGRTEVKLLVGDLVGLIREIELTVDGETLTLKQAENATQTVIRDPAHNTYVLALESDDLTFRLWMIPGSETIQEQTGASYHSRFRAVLEATDPRAANEGQLTPRIVLNCTLSWDI